MPKKVTPAIGGYSPVSYFEKDRAEVGRPEYQAHHRGQTYFFTDPAQVSSFVADPDRFVPAFGGTCAFGRSIGQEFEPDPTRFKIVDDQLLLFLKNDEVDALSLWNQEGDDVCMAKAMQHWTRRSSGAASHTG